MRICADAQTGSVLIRLTAKEATRIASELVKAAIASGGSVEDERQEPPQEKMEREQ